LNILEAIILGVIQGATEFLPISSSGHLLLIPSLVGWNEPDLNAIAISHLGTLLAVLIYFRIELWEISTATVVALIRPDRAGSHARIGINIIIGSIPAAVVGFLAADFIDEALARPVIAAGLLVVTALILVIGERQLSGSLEMGQMSPLNALFIGTAQVLALLPGISRSGVTISAGLSQGLNRPASARYSFLLGVPAIAGAGLFSLLDLISAPDIEGQFSVLAVTLISAALVGYVCIHFLLVWLKQRSLYLFAGYCVSAGVLYLLFQWLT